MNLNAIIQDLFYSNEYNNLSSILNRVNTLFEENIQTSDTVTSDLIDNTFLEEIIGLSSLEDVFIMFVRTLRDVKCVITDEYAREHSVLLQYRDKKKLGIISTSLPHSVYQDQEYTSLEDILEAFRCHVRSLTNYFVELEKIDRSCCVVDPIKPSFKDEFRKILLDDRVWLHIEVTPDGAAANIHLVGNSDLWQEKLQEGLASWDHDRHILENIMTVFDIVNFPQTSNPAQTGTEQIADILCGICLCAGTDSGSVPQPLCRNSKCGVYFHRDCLYQWLIACAGGRIPALGVASGECPSCFQQISCCDKDG